jgi:hypothetical protein
MHYRRPIVYSAFCWWIYQYYIEMHGENKVKINENKFNNIIKDVCIYLNVTASLSTGPIDFLILVSVFTVLS